MNEVQQGYQVRDLQVKAGRPYLTVWLLFLTPKGSKSPKVVYTFFILGLTSKIILLCVHTCTRSSSSSLFWLWLGGWLVGFFIVFGMLRSKIIHKTKKRGHPIDLGHGKISLHDWKQGGWGVGGFIFHRRWSRSCPYKAPH